ncbi:MAG: hypothetical protein Ct9H300mP14_03620 [Gammaproteobacteria bacterium]|nr:MAG: hypothetical protein Ct9H300mP14_03620 [Gammaproteobacteria bacterium]
MKIDGGCLWDTSLTKQKLTRKSSGLSLTDCQTHSGTPFGVVVGFR